MTTIAATAIDPAVAILPTAAALAVAVADYDAAEVKRILRPLKRLQLNALAVVLAAQVHLDEPFRVSVADSDPDTVVSSAIDLAARRFDTSVERIRSGDRHREIVEARQVTAYAARLAGLSYPAIGRALGQDHTTIINSCGRVGEQPRLRRVATQIAASLGWVHPPDDQQTVEHQGELPVSA